MIESKNDMTKNLSFSLFVLLISGFFLGVLTIFSNEAHTQTQLQNETQKSILHNAVGHESHQVVNLQNATENQIFNGTAIFNSSKPVDVISYTEISNITNPNTTLKIWEVGNKNFTPTTLLKNITQGTVNFEGSGVLTHNTMSDPYDVTFSINSTLVDSR